MSEFKDITVKMGECEILLSYDSKTNKIDILSKDIGDIFFRDGLNVDSVEVDYDGNALQGSVMGNLPGMLMK